MLNHPGESLIFQADFLYMVERVDICIEFLKAHRHYKEAEVYLLRFQQCMTRAMTLIKMNFVGSLRALSSEISKRLSEKDVSPTAQHHLLYTRFRSVSTKVAPLLTELERRAQSYPDELSALLAECHTAFLSTRKALLVPRVMEEIRGLDPGRSELVELTREGCGYLKALCRDEWDLYREFFGTGEAGLYQYLESLCDLLYDDLRPRILHEPRLTVLCEVCTVLQALMVLDTSTVSSSASSVSATDSEADSDSSSDAASSSSSNDSTTPSIPRRRRSADLTIPAPPSPTLSHSHSQSHSQKPNTARLSRRLHTAHLLKMVLQDAQTRLFFKAQAVIQSEVRYYVPGEEDLRWPGVLVSSANAASSGTELREKESTNQLFQSISSLAVQATRDTWYPTLKKTIWVVSQLRDFVQPAIFEDISQEALTYCRLSLISASEAIASRPASEAKLDGALFLVRHLLVLKEVWTSLEEVMVKEQGSGSGSAAEKEKEREREREKQKALGTGLGSARALEFGGIGITASASGGVTETLTNMLNKTTSLLPEGLFASLGVTRGPESDMRGIKLDIDHSLRKACEDAIAACANPICEPLDAWTAANSNATQKSNPISVPPSAGPTTSNPNLNPNPALSPQTQTQTDLPTLHLRFLEALQRDLRSGVARIRLYLSEERTVRVLLEHVVERVMGAYERWGEAVGVGVGGAAGTGASARRGKGEGEGEMEVLSSARLREILRDVCGDSGLSFAGYGRV
ncbi:hypothetical protein GALMADRAFT_259460 [Galerina marginata CBS 339.88]|uniref:Conserved oligomeric Golgi complex subunit 3 n=1 Tax=Galerina marginata (strain CBS 339.88) TaxID=685588 RepID=A0A067S8Y3_GALM3|nr:hypothetical protein GALMADRAFT_259460 [Galerina marginata CBS 339.88]